MSTEQTQQGLEIKAYVTKPRMVEAVEVTAENMMQVATWCRGEIKVPDVTHEQHQIGQLSLDELAKGYIKLNVRHAHHERLTRAYVGDKVVRVGKAFRVYQDKSFDLNYDEVIVKLEDAGTPLYDELYRKFSENINDAWVDGLEAETLADRLAKMAVELSDRRNAPTDQMAMAVPTTEHSYSSGVVTLLEESEN